MVHRQAVIRVLRLTAFFSQYSSSAPAKWRPQRTRLGRSNLHTLKPLRLDVAPVRAVTWGTQQWQAEQAQKGSRAHADRSSERLGPWQVCNARPRYRLGAKALANRSQTGVSPCE